MLASEGEAQKWPTLFCLLFCKNLVTWPPLTAREVKKFVCVPRKKGRVDFGDN